MRPHSKEPPTFQPPAPGPSGYEAVRYPEPPIVRQQRAPVFHRSAAPGYRHGGDLPGTYPAHYAQMPAAPNSLSPMAMASERDVGTGSQRIRPTLVLRTRPTARTGVTILMIGALIGGAFGVLTRGRHGAETAAASQQAREEVARETAAAVANPSGGPAAGPQGAAPPPAYANVPFGSLVTPQATPEAAVAAAAIVAKDAKESKESKRAQAHAAWTKPVAHGVAKSTPARGKKDDDGYTIASAGNDSSPPAKEPPKVKEAPKKAEKPEKAERAEKPAKAGKGPDDAVNVLKAAIGATENTL